MRFVLSKVFWAVVNPGNLLAICALAGLLAQLVPSAGVRRLGRTLLGLAALSIVAISILPLGTWLLTPLEERFPVAQPPARVDGIIVLGGSFHLSISADRGAAQLNEHAERITAFATLARRYPDARLVFTGGSALLRGPAERESDFARTLLRDLGIDLGRVIFERDSRNTRDNAVNAEALVRPRDDETWLLVTSAFHMPRAIGAFRRVGWSVTPYPVDHLTGTAPPWPPDFEFTRSLVRVTLGLHEWIGLLAYRLFGWTDQLLPGPRVEPKSVATPWAARSS